MEGSSKDRRGDLGKLGGWVGGGDVTIRSRSVDGASLRRELTAHSVNALNPACLDDIGSER